MYFPCGNLERWRPQLKSHRFILKDLAWIHKNLKLAFSFSVLLLALRLVNKLEVTCLITGWHGQREMRRILEPEYGRSVTPAWRVLTIGAVVSFWCDLRKLYHIGFWNISPITGAANRDAAGGSQIATTVDITHAATADVGLAGSAVLLPGSYDFTRSGKSNT